MRGTRRRNPSILIRNAVALIGLFTGESEPENRPWLILRGKSQFAGDPYGPVVNEKDIEALKE